MKSEPTTPAQSPRRSAIPMMATSVTGEETPKATTATTAVRTPLRPSPSRLARTAPRWSGPMPATTWGTL